MQFRSKQSSPSPATTSNQKPFTKPHAFYAAPPCAFPSLLVVAFLPNTPSTLCCPRAAILSVANLLSGRRLPALMLSSTLLPHQHIAGPPGAPYSPGHVHKLNGTPSNPPDFLLELAGCQPPAGAAPNHARLADDDMRDLSPTEMQ